MGRRWWSWSRRPGSQQHPLKGLFSHICQPPHPHFWFNRSGVGTRICISIRAPGEAAAAGWGPNQAGLGDIPGQTGQ